MLVKKKNPEWFPSEAPRLKVGETIEITDPKQLIVNGDVAPLGENGEEISAFELYGVLVQDEMKDFQEYLKTKKLESQKAALEKEQADLKAQLGDKAETPAPVTVEAKPETVTPKEEKKK